MFQKKITLLSSDLPEVKNDKLEATLSKNSYNLVDLSVQFKNKKGQLSQKALFSILNHYSDKFKAKAVKEDVNVLQAETSC